MKFSQNAYMVECCSSSYAKADLILFLYPIIIIIKGFATTYPSTFPSFIFSKAISLDNFKLSSVIFPDTDGLFHAEQNSLYLVLHVQDPKNVAPNPPFYYIMYKIKLLHYTRTSFSSCEHTVSEGIH